MKRKSMKIWFCRISASNNADAKNGFEVPPQLSGDGEGQLRLPRREYGANQLEKVIKNAQSIINRYYYH